MECIIQLIILQGSLTTHQTKIYIYTHKIKINYTDITEAHIQHLNHFKNTHPKSVYLGQQFRVILLHSFKALKHGDDMGLAQQKGII